MNAKRFQDRGTTISDFMDAIAVTCPRCQKQALVTCPDYPRHRGSPRVACEHCGYNEKHDPTSWKGPVTGVARRRCFSCGRRLEVRITAPRFLTPVRLECPDCSQEMSEPVHWVPDASGQPHDPFFGLPLWFVGSVSGQVLWAYNRKHLAFMKHLVEALIRETAPNQNRSLSNRLLANFLPIAASNPPRLSGTLVAGGGPAVGESHVGEPD